MRAVVLALALFIVSAAASAAATVTLVAVEDGYIRGGPNANTVQSENRLRVFR